MCIITNRKSNIIKRYKIKSILNKLSQYVGKLNTKPNDDDYISWSSTFSIVELEYRVSTFLRVLELEDYIENRDIAYSVTRLHNYPPFS